MSPPEAEAQTSNSTLVAADGWQPMVNTDIKLGNVVLSHPRANHYPAYKTTKMIDFGNSEFAIHLRDQDSKRANNKARSYLQIGTPGSRPPVRNHALATYRTKRTDTSIHRNNSDPLRKDT